MAAIFYEFPQFIPNPQKVVLKSWFGRNMVAENVMITYDNMTATKTYIFKPTGYIRVVSEGIQVRLALITHITEHDYFKLWIFEFKTIWEHLQTKKSVI